MAMADENLDPNRPAEEAKKDTVRINLPPGITGRGGPPSGTPTPPPKPKPAGGPANPEEEAKKETAVMSRPVETPRPKKDTSRVQVVAAKPITADAARPVVKLRRDDEPAHEAAAAPGAAAPGAKGAKPAKLAAAAGPATATDALLSVLAMVLTICVAGYLAYIAFGS